MVRKYHKPLQITKSKEEWSIIEQRINTNGVNAFLQREIIKVKKKFDDCPTCDEFKEIIPPEKNIKKRPYVAINIYGLLEPIAEKMNVHPSEAVDILIIQPLLAQPLSSE